MAKSKLVKIYKDKKTGSFFVRSTVSKEKGFVLRDHKYGKAISDKVSNAELGKIVRDIFKYCK